MSLQQIYDASLHPTFVQQVKAAVWKAAEAIVGEDWQTSGYSQAKATKRHTIGVEILRGNPQTMQSFVNAVAADVEPADPSSVADNDIDTSVAAVWDDIAGVTYEENQ
jgi:hypothetical protein